MSWQKFTVAPKTAAGTGATVALRPTKNSPARMNFTLSSAKAAEYGWGKDDRLEVLLGEGEHHGLIRLRKNGSVGTVVVSERAATRGGRYFAFSLGVVPAYVNRAEPKRWVNVETVEDGWIEFVLPSWADETSPRKQARPHPIQEAGITEAANFRRPARNVTGALMGDPPPGRSALKTA